MILKSYKILVQCFLKFFAKKLKEADVVIGGSRDWDIQ